MRALSIAAAICLATLPFVASAAEQNPAVNGRNGARIAAAAASPGAPVFSPELLFTPITPCRAFNTAAVIPANTTKGFQVTGAASLAFQGGPAAGCGIPASASAVAISLTTVGATSAGFLTAFANDQPRPGVYSHFTSPNQPATSGAVVQLGANGALSVYAQRPTKVVGDVTGYYAPQIAAYMNSDGSVYSSTSRVLSSVRSSAGQYQITLDRGVQLCSVTINIDGGPYYGSAYPSGNAIYTSTWSLNADGGPVYTDLYHNFTVHC